MFSRVKIKPEETHAGKAIISADAYFAGKQRQVEEVRKRREILLQEERKAAKERSVGKSATS